MITKQQQETLEYFNRNARDWRSKASADGFSKINIIRQRNDFVLAVASERPSTKAFLDVGCGTGELVCDMSARGIRSVGVDYAPEMIELATAKARETAVENVEFICSSIFELPIEDGSYDLISANGFIEYISLDQMRDFFVRAARALSPGGSLVVGSRNRLFNLMSMNDYTRAEIAGRSTELLLEESIALSTADGLADLANVATVELQPPDTEHARTVIDVSTRFQYTPLQLTRLVEESGLQASEIYPVHIHAAPPSFRARHPETHASVANLLQEFARGGLNLLPHASSFMLHAVKH
jgi:2-polyprenyl-3-methyl-5-hydroxy-6-metoxy-1,4-benzoquinol methylase